MNALLILMVGFFGDAQGTTVVTNCSDAALRAAMASGGIVSFACSGTITLTNEISVSADTLADASGADITINGAHTVRLFSVHTNTTITMVNLRLSGGAGTNGGAIYNDGGVLTAVGCRFFDNAASNYYGPARGGAILNQGGIVNATNCFFSANSVSSGAYYLNEAPVHGGAVYNAGMLNISNCVFDSNLVFDPDPPYYGQAGGDRYGGAVYNDGQLRGTMCAFVGNSAIAGDGGEGGPGMWPAADPGGRGGTARGGAIYNSGTLALECSLLASNTAAGGAGGSGGTPSPQPPGMGYGAGSGGDGGDGCGGALDSLGPATLVNCTLAWNTGIGGRGGFIGVGRPDTASPGDGGLGAGAITDPNGELALTNCTIAFNRGLGGITYGQATNGISIDSIYASGTQIKNSILLCAIDRTNCTGWLLDWGHNVSSDSSGSLTNTNSKTSTDPKLDSLAANGGLYWTMGLLAGSPARNRAEATAAPNIDQRGYPRPIDGGPDIGAYEDCSPAALRAEALHNGVQLYLYSQPGQTWRLLTGVGDGNWLPMSTNQIPAVGTVPFQYIFAPGDSIRVFKAERL